MSKDPSFAEKLTDIVGLYLNPPDKAVVLCMDEKRQIQALDRTQPGLALKPRRCGTMTHDYKRHGTTTLFAGLDVLTGQFTLHRVGQIYEDATIPPTTPPAIQDSFRMVRSCAGGQQDAIGARSTTARDERGHLQPI